MNFRVCDILKNLILYSRDVRVVINAHDILNYMQKTSFKYNKIRIVSTTFNLYIYNVNT